jgi:quercetin dioxygenase-like cupin family protein
MISLIERAECSPTAVVLEKLAAGFGVMLASLFDAQTEGPAPRCPLARSKDQPQWQDPGSGYIRRNVSPPGMPQSGQIVEVRFPAQTRIVFESTPRGSHMHQQVWILSGSMEIGVGKERHLLHEGDCLAMPLDQPVLFHNPTKKAARYAVVMFSEAQS